MAALKAAEAAEEELEEGAAPVEKKERPEPPALPTFMKWKSSLLQARFCALARGGGCVDPPLLVAHHSTGNHDDG